MVPSEADAALLKKKAEEHALDGKRKKKKKKKQVGTPRPACSWVYFSREFIKEYSASHPESSGLKAATKAASHAWKSMSHEEKAKYTRHAREVWDDYLSTAPARAPKPRKQTKLVTRCSPGRLFNVLQRLTTDQRAAVRSMGFGSLLILRCRTLRRSLCLWLLERFNTTRRSLDICGECIPLSPRDVEFVMGLAACGKDVVNSGPDDLIANLRHSYNATNHGISVRLLEERLAVPEAGEDFKRSFVLYALGTLLSPTARLDVSPSFLHFLTNMDVIHQYNWGKFLLDRLVREVSRYRQGKQRAVGGCLLFLQLFYYESISIEGSSALAPTVVPCLSSWGEEEITEREKREKELGGYGSGKVICKERCFGMESSEYRGQLDGLPLCKTSTGEHGPASEQDRDEANEEQLNGDIAIDEVSVSVLDALFNASSSPDSIFEVAAIVTQPPSRRDRGRKVLPSPVAQYALDRGFPADLIFTPERAGEDALLSNLRALQPELCITAAYGNILPSKFLNIPPMGTVNIHPSLLPLYRGAAPVQRALQDGAKETGVSLAFTVRALDAGPVIAREKMEVDDQIKAPELLVLLFSEGSELLIRELPSILDGSARVKAQPQDDSKATLAPKITTEESWLSFDEEAVVLHNKVRAFAGWPGTRAKMAVVDDRNGQQSIIELKIITTRVCPNIQTNEVDGITFKKDALVVPCGECTALEVLEVQLPGKKAVSAAAFWNGLRGKKLKVL